MKAMSDQEREAVLRGLLEKIYGDGPYDPQEAAQEAYAALCEDDGLWDEIAWSTVRNDEYYAEKIRDNIKYELRNLAMAFAR